jgi:hypothetical protein
MTEPNRSPTIPDKSTISRKSWIVLLITCGVSVLLELTVHRHRHFEEDHSWLANMTNWFGFYVALGFIACSVSILLAKLLGLFLKAPEDYYDDTP